ncbi:MAG: alanine racemase [Candidatus Omnitrophota bacterium]
MRVEIKVVSYRPTWAEVNLDNIAHNFAQVKKIIGPKVKVMACVKADAYGHGIIPVSKKLESCGADYLAVACIDEGIKLREDNVKLPILILGMIFEKDVPALFEYNLIPTVCTEELVIAINGYALEAKLKAKVHIKVDTGMNRIGVLHNDAFDFIKKASKLKFIDIEGVFTHLACADVNSEYTQIQLNLFNQLIGQLKKEGIRIPLVHAANSMGVIGYKGSHFNMVRPGLMLYGLYPKKDLKINLKASLGLKTKVVYIKRLPKGQGISYGHIYITKKDTTIVTLPIGYGDGYPRNLSNQAWVLIGGRCFKISGRVCMDQIMVDVGKTKVNIGDEVVLIGPQGNNKITVEELAEYSGTISYEITCGLGSRIPRIYI